MDSQLKGIYQRKVIKNNLSPVLLPLTTPTTLKNILLKPAFVFLWYDQFFCLLCKKRVNITGFQVKEKFQYYKFKLRMFGMIVDMYVHKYLKNYIITHVFDQQEV